MMKEIVTFEIAQRAKERGFEEHTQLCYDVSYPEEPLIEIGNITGDYELFAPTYHQLIDWVFGLVNQNHFTYPTGEEEVEDMASKIEDVKVEWLEHWYMLLKDCPLKYEFIGRLLEWFRYNNYYFHVDYHRQLNRWDLHYQIGIERYGSKPVDTYEEAQHEGILKVFKLLKYKENEKH